jgi:ligand-binding sensor domain-containing protein/HPt (histidine-containing phosphotransfer) domain-containing protein/two-component sensor histidine kinase
MARFFLLCLVGWLSLPTAARAGDTPPPPWTGYAFPASFEHISTAQGLSHGTVYCAYQDAQGFLWFGTEIGLNRYDGFGYKTYHPEKNNPESIGSEWVNALLEDRLGNLWIATNGGALNRFDRRSGKFTRLYPESRPAEIPSNSIVSLAQDDYGNLWLGTGKGLFMLTEKEAASPSPHFQTFPSAESDPNGQPQEAITGLYLDKQGMLWIGSLTSGLWRVKTSEKGPWRFEHFTQAPAGSPTHGSVPPPNASSIAEDAHGILWIASTQGLYSYTRGTGTFRQYLHDDADDKSLSFNLVRRVYRDRSGGMWVGTDGGGLEKMLPRGRPEDAPRFEHFQHDNKNPASLTSNAIESIFEDRSGVLWVGTYFMGLNKLVLSPGPGDRDRRPLLQYRNIPGDTTSLSGNMVNAVAEDGFGNLWIGTDGYGLNRVVRPATTGGAFRFDHFRAGKAAGSLPDDVVTGLYLDSEKRLWMTTYTAGLVRIDAASPTARPVFTQYKHDPADSTSLHDDFVWSVLEDRSHRLWVGTDGGALELFDPRSGTFSHFLHEGSNPGEISESALYSLQEDSYGTLWIGSYFGVNRFNPETREFKCYYQTEKPGALSDSYAGTVYLDRAGTLWVGTNSAGLNRVAIPPWNGPEPEFVHFGTKEGLPDNTVMGILEDGRGQLWISTSQALCRFDPQGGKAHRFVWSEEMRRTSYIRNAAHRGPNGELFFGGSNGFSLFRPEDIVYNSYAPPVVITDFKILNRSAGLHDRTDPAAGAPEGKAGAAPTPDITLSAKDYEFSFEFAAMHFVAPGQNQYAFKMEGLDQDWNYSGNKHFIAYTTLPAGDYTFLAKGSNCDGIWGEEALSLRIHVLPPWWKTWWFRTLLILFGGGAVLMGIRLRLRALRDQNRILGEMVAEKTREMKDILDNIEQGLFTIGLDGKVNPDHALITNSILHVDNVAAHTVQDLFRMDERQQQEWDIWLQMIKMKHASMKWGKLVRLSPIKLLTLWGENGPRFVQIAFQKMFDREKRFNKLMILAQDITDVRRKEERIEEEKIHHERSVKAILGIAHNAATVPVLIEDMDSRLAAMREVLAEIAPGNGFVSRQNMETLFRETHTMKGTAASFGFENLSAACLEFENHLAEIRGRGGKPEGKTAQRLTEGLVRMKSAMEEIRGLANRLTGVGVSAIAAVPLNRVDRIRELCRVLRIRPGKDGDGPVRELIDLCEALDHKKLGILTENYRLMLERVAERSGKKVEFLATPQDFELSPRTLMELNEPLIHLLRNAVDHGLETEEERKRLGKPPAGRVELHIAGNPDGWIVSVADDGAGVNTDKVAQRAMELGLTTWEKLERMDENEKDRLIFAAGLTTRKEVTDVSGRGVGMHAVAVWAEAAGGTVEIESKRGQGTRISLRLPARDASAADWAPRAKKPA